MKFNRIFAILLRHLYQFKYNLDRQSDVFYWPVVDLILWGIAGSYFQASGSETPLVIMVVSGIVFWIAVLRGQNDISISVLAEMWDRNLIHLFASPLKFREWALALMILGVIKAAVSFLFGVLVAFLLYRVGIFMYGFAILPFLAMLLMSGWWIGFFVGGLTLRFGTRIQTLAWTLVFIISPFIGIFYPVSALPSWGQTIAHLLPPSYIFEGMREIIISGSFDYSNLVISLVLNIIYIVPAYAFFRWNFTHLLSRGLAKAH